MPRSAPQPSALPTATGDVYTDLRTWVALFLDWLANPVTRAALQPADRLPPRQVDLNGWCLPEGRCPRSPMAELLSGDAERADTVFGFATHGLQAHDRSLAGSARRSATGRPPRSPWRA